MFQKRLTGIVVVLLAAGAVWYLWPKSCPPLAQNLTAMLDEARDLQHDGKDDDALKKWKEFLSQLPTGECFDGERTTASQSVSQIEKRQGEPSVGSVTVQEVPPNFTPPPGEVQRAVGFYTVGRRVKSLAMLSVTGQGVFRDWGFKSSRYFAYLHQVPVDTVVVDNQNGKLVVFEQTIGDLAELTAVSNEQLELDLPKSPILEELDRRASNYFWQYRIVRDLVRGLEKLDPHLRRTLTPFQKLLRRNGIPLSDDYDATYIARIKELAGTHVRVEYVVGLGVTKLDVLDGKKFPKETLLRFVRDVNAAADLLLEKELEAAQNKPFRIQIGKLGSLLSVDGDATGELELEKAAAASGQDPNVDQLNIIGGQVQFKARDGSKAANGEVTPKPGSYLKYDWQKHLVTEAEVEWNITSQWQSGDHLFFQAESLHGIQAKSSNRAVLVK